MARKKVSPVLKRPNGLLAEDVLDSDDDDSSCLSDVSVRSEECLESTGTDEKEVKMLRVDEKNLIWRCDKALSFSYNCCFALCGSCHDSSAVNNRSKRGKLDKDSCNHSSLIPCGESLWFTKTYLDNFSEEEVKKFPTNCAHCKIKFLNQ